MKKPVVRIDLSAQGRVALEGLGGPRCPVQAGVVHWPMVLAAAGGLENKQMCQWRGVVPNKDGRWHPCHAMLGRDGHRDEPQPAASAEIGDDEILETRHLTLVHGVETFKPFSELPSESTRH